MKNQGEGFLSKQINSLNLILVTGRTILQGTKVEEKLSKHYEEYVAVARLNPKDMAKLGVKSRDTVKVMGPGGEVVVKAQVGAEVPEGVIFIPMGPWAECVVEPRTDSTGMPGFKSIPVKVMKTDEPVTPLSKIYGYDGQPLPNLGMSLEIEAKGDVKRFTDVVCPFCGCLCDNLIVNVYGNRIVKVLNACPLSLSKFMGIYESRILEPKIKVNGEFVKVPLEKAIEKAAEILINAKYPVLYGWASTSVETIRLGLELAEIVGGVFDHTATFCHGPTALGFHEIGMPKSTLGQIKNRADVIVYWGSNVTEAHPMHPSRYSFTSIGRFRKGRKDRKLIVIDVRETGAARNADMFIQVEPGKDFELLVALRLLVQGKELEAPVIAGVPREKVVELADTLMSAKFGVMFVGVGLTMSGAKEKNFEELFRLLHDLNTISKWVVIPMRGHFNVTGADLVMIWTTGYPYAVDLSRRYPRYQPGITSTADIFLRGEADALLNIASDPLAHFPKKVVENMMKVPIITIDPKWSLTAAFSKVVIPSAFVGIECPGTAYRMDDVPIRLKKIVDPPPGVLCDEEIVRMLLEKVKEKLGVKK
ncbi:MAG: formylmethanofuran dehydrogenase subunit B [Thermoprotei archaeon]|nr:MAG: formylmethanofuran dehydrogenase subunit B [Thermoprotei archaeon]